MEYDEDFSRLLTYGGNSICSESLIESLSELVKDEVLSKCSCTLCKSKYSSTRRRTYFLSKTRYMLVLNYELIYWCRIDNADNYTMYCKNTWGMRITFAKMFEKLPDNLKEKLIFHLDVFSKI